MITEACAITVALSAATIACCALIALTSVHKLASAMKGVAGPVVGLVNAFSR